MLAIIPTDAIAADNIAKTSMWLTAEGSFRSMQEEFVEFISLKFVSYMLQVHTLTKLYSEVSSGLAITSLEGAEDLNSLDHPAGKLKEFYWSFS